MSVQQTTLNFKCLFSSTSGTKYENESIRSRKARAKENGKLSGRDHELGFLDIAPIFCRFMYVSYFLFSYLKTAIFVSGFLSYSDLSLYIEYKIVKVFASCFLFETIAEKLRINP